MPEQKTMYGQIIICSFIVKDLNINKSKQNNLQIIYHILDNKISITINNACAYVSTACAMLGCSLFSVIIHTGYIQSAHWLLDCIFVTIRCTNITCIPRCLALLSINKSYFHCVTKFIQN